jgi:hypothetical protein
MRSSTFAILLTAVCMAYAAVTPTNKVVKKAYEGPNDYEIQKLSLTRLVPPYPAPDPKIKQEVGWRYLTTTLKPEIPRPKRGGNCHIKVFMDVVSAVLNKAWPAFLLIHCAD